MRGVVGRISKGPSAPFNTHAPEVRMTSAVIVQTTMVSMKVPSMAMTPWRTGLFVCAVSQVIHRAAHVLARPVHLALADLPVPPQGI